MNFDAVIISEDRYLIEALRSEFFAIGYSCGVGTSDIGDTSVIIYDVSSDNVFLKNENKVIYIFPSDKSAEVSNGKTVFTKPFVMSELLKAFINLRHSTSERSGGEVAFSISVSDTFLIVCGKRIDLTKNEMIIFNALWDNKGNAVGREHLDKITRANSNGNMVTVYINRLREKLSSVTEKKVIITVRDKGYKIADI